MLGYSKSAAVVLLHLFLLLGNAYGAPTIPEKRTAHTALRVARDGENLAQSTTVTVTNVLDTSVGQMLQICTVQLDPITGDNGEPLVRETKSCKVTMANSGNNSSGSGSSSGDGSQATSTNSSSASDASSTSADASSTASDASATSTADSSSATDGNASSTTDAASASATSTSGGAVSAGGVTLVPGSSLPSGATGAGSATATATGTGSAASASATASSGGAKAVQGNGFTTIDASAVSSGSATATATASGTDASAAGAASSASSAADQAATSAAKFQLPGTQLSVLPIGLGVFAGISVIALIVVGLVTYERTKYRKAFRQRKLAESGAAMGYGGMAQAA